MHLSALLAILLMLFAFSALLLDLYFSMRLEGHLNTEYIATVTPHAGMYTEFFLGEGNYIYIYIYIVLFLLSDVVQSCSPGSLDLVRKLESRGKNLLSFSSNQTRIINLITVLGRRVILKLGGGGAQACRKSQCAPPPPSAFD